MTDIGDAPAADAPSALEPHDVYKGAKNEKGEKHGHGVFKQVDGNKHDGEFFNDVFEGEGKHWWPSGAKYVGQWEDGKKHGFGKYTYPNGSTYSGMWVHDAREGAAGTFEYSTNEVYVGGSKADQRDGQGTFLWCSGRLDLCGWVEGKIVGEGVRFSEDGRRAWRTADGVEGEEMPIEEANALRETFDAAQTEQGEAERAAAVQAAADRKEAKIAEAAAGGAPAKGAKGKKK